MLTENKISVKWLMDCSTHMIVIITDSKMLDSLDRILGMNTQSASNSDDVIQQASVSTKSIRFVMVIRKLIFVCRTLASPRSYHFFQTTQKDINALLNLLLPYWRKASFVVESLSFFLIFSLHT